MTTEDDSPARIEVIQRGLGQVRETLKGVPADASARFLAQLERLHETVKSWRATPPSPFRRAQMLSHVLELSIEARLSMHQ